MRTEAAIHQHSCSVTTNTPYLSEFSDNGEFACGDILKNCLTKVEGFNVLVCVSRTVDGMFVTDMVSADQNALLVTKCHYLSAHSVLTLCDEFAADNPY